MESDNIPANCLHLEFSTKNSDLGFNLVEGGGQRKPPLPLYEGNKGYVII